MVYDEFLTGLRETKSFWTSIASRYRGGGYLVARCGFADVSWLILLSLTVTKSSRCRLLIMVTKERNSF